jgi:hypothetical protein
MKAARRCRLRPSGWIASGRLFLPARPARKLQNPYERMLVTRSIISRIRASHPRAIVAATALLVVAVLGVAALVVFDANIA